MWRKWDVSEIFPCFLESVAEVHSVKKWHAMRHLLVAQHPSSLPQPPCQSARRTSALLPPFCKEMAKTDGLMQTHFTHGLLWRLSSKESAHKAGGTGLILRWGRPLGKGNGNPLQYSCLENPTDREACRATVKGGLQKRWIQRSDETKPTNFMHSFLLKLCNVKMQKTSILASER